MARTPEAGPQVKVLSRREGKRLFDRVARENLGISGKEFAERFSRGEFHGDTPAEVTTAMDLPFYGQRSTSR